MGHSKRWYHYWSSPSPWYFYPAFSQSENAIRAANQGLIVSGVAPDVGALMAAAPTLYATLYQLGRTLHPHDPRLALVNRALRRASTNGSLPEFKKSK